MILLSFNQAVYKQLSDSKKLPLLLPQVLYSVDVKVENIEPSGAPDQIKVIVVSTESTVPLITANLNMPVSEPNLD